MTWNPEQYLKFAQPRLRPAIDLVARVALAAPPHTLIADSLHAGAWRSTLEPLLRPAPSEEDYARRVRDAYPAEGDGTTLFPFRRLFIVATKA